MILVWRHVTDAI